MISDEERPLQQSTAKEDPAETNIEAIARLERRFARRRTMAERCGARITALSGSTTSVILHFVWFIIWILLNTGAFGSKAFDPFPFGFLTLIVSLEAIILSLLVLNTQNRMSKDADRRAHLNLQVDLLAEQELTLVIELLDKISHKLGVETKLEKTEARNMMKKTDVEKVMKKIEDILPEE
jgi:uncharacterized membrane protein